MLNVVLFMPLGLFLPLLWKAYRSIFRTMLLGFGISLFLEAMQIFTYRASDINDLITNTVGTLLGYCIGRGVLLLFPAIAPEESSKDVKVLLGISLGVMFFLYPFLAKILF